VQLPPVLLLPGMMLDERLYTHQIAALSSLTEVQVADLTRQESICAMAEDVLNNAPERFALVGLSMGGIVGFEIWRQARERVTHLALLDTTPYADRPERRVLRDEQIEAAARGELRQLMVETMKPRYLAGENRQDVRLLELIIEMALSYGAEIFTRQSLALRDRASSEATLATIDCPSLVLCGREDALCPVDVHTQMALAMRRADLVLLTGSGHLSPLERPEAVSSALVTLLRRTS
jgi:pimeloyl-ACP methyl ester carboxylesterase